MVASSAYDEFAHVWRRPNADARKWMSFKHQGSVNCSVFSGDSRWLVTGVYGAQAGVVVHDLRAGASVVSITDRPSIYSLSFWNQGRELFVAGDSGEVRRYQVPVSFLPWSGARITLLALLTATRRRRAHSLPPEVWLYLFENFVECQ